MNMKAPFSTPTSRGGPPGVVGGDLLAELGDPGLELVLRDDHPADVVASVEEPSVGATGVPRPRG